MGGLAPLSEVSACGRSSGQRLAALLTCHNRRDQTLRCLASLATAKEVVSTRVDVDTFLVDDGCSDGTAAAVRSRFPDVHVIAGTGCLFWCGGMRLAWTHAARK